MTLIEQRAAGRPGPCAACKGRKSCCSAAAMACQAFADWTAVPWKQRAHEEYLEHLRWMMRCLTWKEEEKSYESNP